VFFWLPLAYYQFLHDQYRAVSLLGGLLSHPCLALKLRLRSGLLFLMVILGSPYLMVLLSPPWQALTTNFFGPPGVRLGLLQGSSLGFIIYLIGLKVARNRILKRLECLLVALKKA